MEENRTHQVGVTDYYYYNTKRTFLLLLESPIVTEEMLRACSKEYTDWLILHYLPKEETTRRRKQNNEKKIIYYLDIPFFDNRLLFEFKHLYDKICNHEFVVSSSKLLKLRDFTIKTINRDELKEIQKKIFPCLAYKLPKEYQFVEIKRETIVKTSVELPYRLKMQLRIPEGVILYGIVYGKEVTLRKHLGFISYYSTEESKVRKCSDNNKERLALLYKVLKGIKFKRNLEGYYIESLDEMKDYNDDLLLCPTELDFFESVLVKD